MEKEEQSIPPESKDEEGFYFYTKTRILDVLAGISGGVMYVIFVTILMVAFKVETIWWFFGIFVVLYLGIILYCFYKKRKYLGIGFIFAVTGLPAIIGGCMYLIS